MTRACSLKQPQMTKLVYNVFEHNLGHLRVLLYVLWNAGRNKKAERLGSIFNQ